jgi:hypothetical protein
MKLVRNANRISFVDDCVAPQVRHEHEATAALRALEQREQSHRSRVLKGWEAVLCPVCHVIDIEEGRARWNQVPLVSVRQLRK